MWMESFRFAGKNYAGVQTSDFTATELSWDNGDPAYAPPYSVAARAIPTRGYGRWIGPGTNHLRPGEMNVIALDESVVALEKAGHDELARVTESPVEGALLRASWTRFNPGSSASLAGNLHLILQDALSGALLLEETELDYRALFYDLPALSQDAVLWLRYDNLTRGWALPPDYLSVRGFSSVPDKFKYSEDGVNYVWDYEADVGRRPSNTAHPFYALEHEAFLAGQLVHRGAWTQYIVDGTTQGGSWSALRLKIGAGGFVVGPNFQPAPGAVLYELTGENTRIPVLVDPLALSVSAVPERTPLRFGDNAGKCRLGGTIAARSGPLTAYWDFHPDTPVNNLCAALLGVSDYNFVNACEASLYPIVSDILELAPELPETRSTELVLTHAFLHEYLPDASEVTEALPGLPRATKGHPGGRCIRKDGNKIRFFTEYFGNIGARGGNKFASFYNAMREIDAYQQVRGGTGTAFHGDNCAELCWNSLYGWAQDKPFGYPAAKQYLAVMKSGAWDDSGMAPFDADSYLWQRLRALETEEGIRLLAAGKAANSEKPLWGVSDGTHFRDAWLPFRARRLTRVTDENGEEWLYAVGRFVTQAEDGLYDVANRWSVIRISGDWVKSCAEWDAGFGEEGAFTLDLAAAENAGTDVEKLPAYLWWIVDATQPAGGYWVRGEAVPTGERVYLVLSVDESLISYAPPSGMKLPYDPLVWCGFCFTVYQDGGIGNDYWPPLPCCEDAGCVVEPPPPPPPSDICVFWDNDLRRFAVPLSEAMTAGFDEEDFSPFLIWVEDASYQTGGYWENALSAPLDETPYLELGLEDDLIIYAGGEGVVLPYEPLMFDKVCFEIGGSVLPPQPSTIYYLVEQKEIEVQTGGPWATIQVSDTTPVDAYHGLRQLRMIGQFIPNLWMRIDSDEAPDDLSTYTIRVPWNEPFFLPREARSKIEVVALYVGSIGAEPVFETVRIN